jgi:hypothetical protein
LTKNLRHKILFRRRFHISHVQIYETLARNTIGQPNETFAKENETSKKQMAQEVIYIEKRKKFIIVARNNKFCYQKTTTFRYSPKPENE